jgi:hypothetical protein
MSQLEITFEESVEKGGSPAEVQLKRDLRKRPAKLHCVGGRKDVAFSYLAGLLDGEGHFGIFKRMPKRAFTPIYHGRISLTMCTLPCIEFMADVMGMPHTMIRHRCMSSRGPNYRDTHRLQVNSERTRSLCIAILPYLKLKQEQAACLIKLRVLQTRPKLENTVRNKVFVRKFGRNAGQRYTTRRRSDDYLAQCEVLYQRCKELNKRGPR